jgi:hypothetical protein
MASKMGPAVAVTALCVAATAAMRRRSFVQRALRSTASASTPATISARAEALQARGGGKWAVELARVEEPMWECWTRHLIVTKEGVRSRDLSRAVQGERP